MVARGGRPEATLGINPERRTLRGSIMEVSGGGVIVPRPSSAVGRLFSAPAVLAPSRRSGKLGVYDEFIGSIAQELRALGVVAEWSEPAGSRAWAARRSADQIALVVDLVIGVASNAAWEGLVAILHRRGRQRVRATVGSRVAEEATECWVQIDGDAEAVANILRDLNPWAGEGK